MNNPHEPLPQQVMQNGGMDTIGSPIDKKIDTKVSYTVFFWAISAVAVVSLSISGILFSQLSGLNNKTNELDKNSAVMQVEINSLKKNKRNK